MIMSKNLVGTSNQANREKWLEEHLKDIPSGKKILDAGAGEAVYKQYCSHLEYTSQDFNKYREGGNGLGLQEKKWDSTHIDIVSDIAHIPVDDSSFDAVMCIEVLEHICDPIQAIKEFSRILKSKGILIITAPFCSLTHMAPYYFANGYSKYWYKEVLKEQGFEIKEINYNGNYFEYLGQELRRLPEMEDKYTYSFQTNKFIYRLAIKLMLKLLSRLSNKNKESEEVLCFGLHIIAQKL